MQRHRLPEVLVVDDDANLRSLLRRFLEYEGYPVLEAADGLAALALLHSAPAPLIMLSNHHMPHLDGPGLFAHILADPLLPTQHAYLYMTADCTLAPAALRQLSALRAQVVWKPFDTAQLLAAVADAAARPPSAPMPRLAEGSTA